MILMFTVTIMDTAMAKDIIAAVTAKENLISAAGTEKEIIAAATAKDMCAEKNNLLFYAFFSHQRLKPA